ncbi:MAG TPA: bifunctional glutamate N-acetyltransferase/amino-acid acetyltransferase ArgJ [Candidatus Sulfotelmatobacter sp.]|nr:bifunctional glutamate N-acetyltransferase/amino-acid acetyltransferase ArgJ [Candidatus Sulfotelmatobacter sp.]
MTSSPETMSPADFALAPGFRSAGVTCGLKASGREDLALIAADRDCSAAGVFTTNRVVAAPVVLDRDVIAKRAGGVRAIVANSGCANACTGDQGMNDAKRMAWLASQAVGCDPGQVLVLSTGVIGVPLAMDKIERGVTLAASALAAGGDSAGSTVRAIMTTDTRPKTAGATAELRGGGVVIRGFAKGAGMIHPRMATMLAVITTDALVPPELLQRSLVESTGRSFNRVSVDGDMSTNDTVLLLASGASRVRVDEAERGPFTAALTEVCASLARQIARDGEGATRLVEVSVTGAASERDAHLVADAIARSALVKTAVHGGDPNWGRVLAAAGTAGVPIAPERLALWFGEGADAIRVVNGGMRDAYDERGAAERLRRDPVAVRLDLGLGGAEATVWTCDFSADYVSINADYTT